MPENKKKRCCGGFSNTHARAQAHTRVISNDSRAGPFFPLFPLQLGCFIYALPRVRCLAPSGDHSLHLFPSRHPVGRSVGRRQYSTHDTRGRAGRVFPFLFSPFASFRPHLSLSQTPHFLFPQEKTKGKSRAFAANPAFHSLHSPPPRLAERGAFAVRTR